MTRKITVFLFFCTSTKEVFRCMIYMLNGDTFYTGLLHLCRRRRVCSSLPSPYLFWCCFLFSMYLFIYIEGTKSSFSLLYDIANHVLILFICGTEKWKQASKIWSAFHKLAGSRSPLNWYSFFYQALVQASMCVKKLRPKADFDNMSFLMMQHE